MSRDRQATKGLTFYEKSHRYRLDGEWVPGVTTVLGVLDKPGLKHWAAGAVAEFVADEPSLVDLVREKGGRDPAFQFLKSLPFQKRDDAAKRGTTLHDFAEQIVRGEEVSVPDDLVPVVESTIAFLEQWHIEPVLIEACVASRQYGYAGKLDLIARYRRPDTGETGVGVFDYKSGKRIYPTTALQNQAYVSADFHGLDGNEKPLPRCDASFGVHIRADDYDVVPLHFGPDVWDDFLTVRQAFAVNKRVEGDYKVLGSGYAGIPIPSVPERVSA